MADTSLTGDVLHNEETEIDTLGESKAEAIAEDTTEEIDPAQESGETRNPINDFLEYREYRVRNQTIVRRQRRVVYQTNTENLVERQDLRYRSFEWVQVFRWTNETDSDNTFNRTVTEGLTVTEGQETERNFGVSASFRGLGVSAGGSTKHFSERETSRATTISKTIVVPARTTVTFYQKRYNFLVEVWWWQRVPNWPPETNHFRIGANVTYARVQRTADVEILAEEYATLHRDLSESTNIDAVAAPTQSDDPRVTRQFVNITQRAKNELRQWGITG